MHLRLHSATCLMPAFLNTCVIIAYYFVWRNPFESIQGFPVIFISLSLLSFTFVCTLHTIIVKIAVHQVRAEK
jgi:hypothetical protein